MKRFRWRLRPLVVLAAVASLAIGLLVAHSASDRFLRSRLASLLPPGQVDAVLDEFATAFLAFSAIAIAIGVILALILGTAAVRALGRLRSDAASRARGMAQPPWRPPIVEFQALSAAVERMAHDFVVRADALRRERDELSLLVNSVSEGILLIEPGGRIMHANPAARNLLGLPEQCRGQPLSSLVRSAELRAAAERIASTRETLTSEVALADRRILVVGKPIASAESYAQTGNDAPGAVVALIDLTELRRLEGVRRDFVANVSHELKTPLTSIRGYVETLLADDLDRSMQHQFLDVIQKNAERLHNIVDDLLDLSKLESGGWKPRIADVALAPLIDDVWDGLSARAREKSIGFSPPDLDAHVAADESALRQILTNLFDNAIRHTAPGGAVRVTLRADPARVRHAPNGTASAKPDTEPRYVAIEVQDTGSGIPGDALPRIFERFYRVDPARSRAEGGTGLGLSIVKHLAESMDGDVSASSELGKGTLIRVRLPARPLVPV
jgi:two-component system, OmpR family, phosphate regulon sensor histidine kinase PhoR